MKMILLFLLIVSTPVIAGEKDSAADFLVRCQDALEGRTDWNWTVIRARVILEMGFEIPAIASVSVNPEVELYFTKQ